MILFYLTRGGRVNGTEFTMLFLLVGENLIFTRDPGWELTTFTKVSTSR